MDATAITELAVFDLDNTLLAGDSDYLWGQFLVDSGHVNRDSYEAANQRFYEEYQAGTLDIVEFSRFSLQPLTTLDPALLQNLRQQFLEQRIQPVIAPGAAALLNRHRSAGHDLLITTATNSFVTAPIARLLGIDNLLATEPEIVDGRYTGALSGTPNFREGKIIRLQQWMQQQRKSYARIHVYSDSHNDLPLLELADQATAVDPDDTLRVLARERGWPVITLRTPGVG